MRSVNFQEHLSTYMLLRQLDEALADVFLCYVIAANAHRQVVLPDRVLVDVLNISKGKVYLCKRGLMNLRVIERSPFFEAISGKELVLRVCKPAQTAVTMVTKSGYSTVDTVSMLRRIAINKFPAVAADDPYRIAIHEDSVRPGNNAEAVENEAEFEGGGQSEPEGEQLERKKLSGNYRMPDPVTPQHLSVVYKDIKSKLQKEIDSNNKVSSVCNENEIDSSLHTHEHPVLSADAVSHSTPAPFVDESEIPSDWLQLQQESQNLVAHWMNHKEDFTIPKGLEGSAIGEQFGRLTAFAAKAAQHIIKIGDDQSQRLNRFSKRFPEAFASVYPELTNKFSEDVSVADATDAPPSSTDETGALPVKPVEVGHLDAAGTATKPELVLFDEHDYKPDVGLEGEAAKQNVLRKQILGVVDGWNERAKVLGLESVFITKKERAGEIPFRNKKLAEQIGQWLVEAGDEWIQLYKVALSRLNNSVCLGEIEGIGSFKASLGWLFNPAYAKGRGIDRLLCADYVTKKAEWDVGSNMEGPTSEEEIEKVKAESEMTWL